MSETTTVITATSIIKIWTRKPQEKQMEASIPGHRAEEPSSSSGLSMKQMVTLLLLTTLLNFMLTHSQILLDGLATVSGMGWQMGWQMRKLQ
jgi:hypothetical protein